MPIPISHRKWLSRKPNSKNNTKLCNQTCSSIIFTNTHNLCPKIDKNIYNNSKKQAANQNYLNLIMSDSRNYSERIVTSRTNQKNINTNFICANNGGTDVLNCRTELETHEITMDNTTNHGIISAVPRTNQNISSVTLGCYPDIKMMCSRTVANRKCFKTTLSNITNQNRLKLFTHQRDSTALRKSIKQDIKNIKSLSKSNNPDPFTKSSQKSSNITLSNNSHQSTIAKLRSSKHSAQTLELFETNTNVTQRPKTNKNVAPTYLRCWRRKWLHLAALACVLLTVISTTDAQNYSIGAVLSKNDKIEIFNSAIRDLEKQDILPHGVKMLGVSLSMDRNPIRTAQNVCERLISNRVYAVIISHPTAGELSPAAVSYTCGFYNIPVIGISSRDSSLSDKNLHTSFMRTIPPYSNQADVWIEALRHLGYKCVTFIHSSDNDGRSTLGRFQNLADPHGIKVEDIIEYETGITHISQKLEEAQGRYCRVFILYASTKDAESIFREVDALNMTSPGYVWIVSEQALLAPNKPDGILGIKLVNSTDEVSHIRDSVTVIAKAFVQLLYNETAEIEPAPSSCIKHEKEWITGQRFMGYLKEVQIQNGHTGMVAFDDKGDRINSDYDIINIINGRPYTVGEYVYSQVKKEMTLTLNVKDVVWPGMENKKPRGYIVPTHLKVVTVAEKPFTWVRPVEDQYQCLDDEITCPRRNRTSGEMEMYCCRGYCMDLLNNLASLLNFTYNLYQVEDGLYGSFDFVNGSEKKMWTGMVGDLVYERADMVVAPLTINPERSQAIEFSKPFKYQGITILEKKHPKSSTLASFLQPFQKTLWMLVMVSVHVVALALYLLDRFSPFGRYRLPQTDAAEEDALNLSSAIWFAWGVLLNSGIGEGTPRSFSARVLGMVWAGFAMIVVASYTANLAAFLVLDRPETSLTGINDARLRNPMDNFKYATVKGSSVDMYFRRQVELSNMYRTMEGKNYDSAEEAIAAVKFDGLSAFIWDSSRLEYEAAQDCNLVTAGEQFGRSGYGIGLQKHSLWADQVTLALLGMHESGYMEELDNRWILQGSETCEKNEKFPATLGLRNMAGVFILVAAGIVGGIALIVIEIMYKKHQTRNQQRMELTRRAYDKWRGNVEKKKTLRATLQAQKRFRANGMGAYTIERGMQGLLSQTPAPRSAPPLPPRGGHRKPLPAIELEPIRTPDIDTEVHHLPPPPPPPASSPAVRMRGGRVSYTPRLFPGGDRFDIPV